MQAGDSYGISRSPAIGDKQVHPRVCAALVRIVQSSRRCGVRAGTNSIAARDDAAAGDQV